MKVLVTGASGFIGSTLIEILVGMNFKVRVLMRESSSETFLKGLAYEKAIGDIRNPPSLAKACEGIDCVVHLAGLTSAKDRREYFEFNSVGTQNVGRACLEQNVKRLIYVSSLAAGGPSHGLIPKKESDPSFPVSAYGESKLRGELFLEEMSDQLKFVVLRPPLVYGPKDRAMLALFQLLSKNWMPILKGNTNTGHKYYSAVYVDDLVQSILRLIQVEEGRIINGERFYVSDGQIYTWEKIMQSLSDALNAKPIRFNIPRFALNGVGILADGIQRFLPQGTPLNRDKFAEINADFWICSNEKLTQKTGFQPTVSLAVGAKKTADWYRNQGWLGA